MHSTFFSNRSASICRAGVLVLATCGAMGSAIGGANAGSDATTDAPVPAASAPSVPALTPGFDLRALLAATMVHGRAVPAMGAVLIRQGKVMDLAVIGLRAAGGTDPVQTGDVWHLGSTGKAMTATLVARLVERGVLSWDAPLRQTLPELAADMQAAYREVTLRDLLAHQSGMQPDIDESWVAVFHADPRPLHAQRMAYARTSLAQALAFARGQGDGYSNSGVLIAALVAERATGQAYETLMQREVFEPLGLRSAGFGATRRGQPLGHKAGVAVQGTQADNPAVIAPAGGIHMSLQDWARFAIDQMAGEQGRGKLLKAEGYRLLHQAAREGGKFALGWRLQKNMAGVSARHLAHTGSNGSWFALIVLKPDSDDAILVTSNAGEDAMADKAVRDVATRVLKLMAP